MVQASIREFADQGYVAARVESITQRAGVGYGTFYRYFGSKVDVIRYLADRVYSDLYEPVGREPKAHMPVAERIFGNILEFLFAYARNREAFTVVEDAAGSDPEIAARVRELQQDHANRYAEKMEWPGYHPISNRRLIAEVCVSLGYSVAKSWARSSNGREEQDKKELEELARIVTLMTMAVVDPDALYIPRDLVHHVVNELPAQPTEVSGRVSSEV